MFNDVAAFRGKCVALTIDVLQSMSCQGFDQQSEMDGEFTLLLPMCSAALANSLVSVPFKS